MAVRKTLQCTHMDPSLHETLQAAYEVFDGRFRGPYMEEYEVWKAAKAVEEAKKQYGKKKRKAVKRLGDTPVTLYSKSIVWQYFAAGKKKFSELRNAV